MAQVKLLKINGDGIPKEMDTAADDITLNSFSVQGGGPVLSSTGLDLNGQAATDAASFQVTDPTVGYLNQTAGNLIFDNIMAKERSNLMTTAGEVLFPVVTNSAGQLDNLRIPAVAGTPTATPTNSGEGFMVWDSTNDKLYVWGGSSWVDQTSISYAPNVQNSFTAGEALSARDVVYISAADTVSKALGDSTSKSYAMGFAVAAAASSAPVSVQEDGVMSGFSSLTPGARYYLDPSSAGAITATVPVGTGNTICQVGYSVSSTKLHIRIQQLGRRA